MGKILESLGVIDGHDIITLSKRKVKKDEMFQEILKVDSNIQMELSVLVEENSARIFAIVKKNIIKGLYIFKSKEQDGESTLVHIKTLYVPEVSEEVRGKYDEHVTSIAKEMVVFKEYDKVVLENDIVEPKKHQDTKGKFLSSLFGFLIGFGFSSLLFPNNLIVAIGMALLFSTTFYTAVHVRKRRK